MSESIPGAPVSPLFTIQSSPGAGRGVFASCDIPFGTPIWTSNNLNVHVILREYRREVCGHCFTYDRGNNHKIRDAVHGFSFCSQECATAWKARDELSLKAWAVVERLVKSRSKEDIELVDADCPKPTGMEIKTAWIGVQKQAAMIREARAGSSTKSHRKAVQQAISNPVSADTLPLHLSTTLLRYEHPETWRTVVALAADKLPYKSAEELQSHIYSYLHLLAILPEDLVEHVTPETLLTSLTRDSWNSFGIRSLEDDGSEFFGYGVWPSASYFNHSCEPNIKKQRVGSVWHFTADRDIAAGEELCITYLSGEERALRRNARMARLRKAWGFECACVRCRDI